VRPPVAPFYCSTILSTRRHVDGGRTSLSWAGEAELNVRSSDLSSLLDRAAPGWLRPGGRPGPVGPVQPPAPTATAEAVASHSHLQRNWSQPTLHSFSSPPSLRSEPGLSASGGAGGDGVAIPDLGDARASCGGPGSATGALGRLRRRSPSPAPSDPGGRVGAPPTPSPGSTPVPGYSHLIDRDGLVRPPTPPRGAGGIHFGVAGFSGRGAGAGAWPGAQQLPLAADGHGDDSLDPPEPPSRTLFVRNIKSSVERGQLSQLFSTYGTLRGIYTACKHRGFVMVTYYDIRSAKAALRRLQGRVVRRRRLDIHYSRPKPSAMPGGGGGEGGGGGGLASDRGGSGAGVAGGRDAAGGWENVGVVAVWPSSIADAMSCSDIEVHAWASRFGEVMEVRQPRERSVGGCGDSGDETSGAAPDRPKRPPGLRLVEFYDTRHAAAAVAGVPQPSPRAWETAAPWQWETTTPWHDHHAEETADGRGTGAVVTAEGRPPPVPLSEGRGIDDRISRDRERGRTVPAASFRCAFASPDDLTLATECRTPGHHTPIGGASQVDPLDFPSSGAAAGAATGGQPHVAAVWPSPSALDCRHQGPVAPSPAVPAPPDPASVFAALLRSGVSLTEVEASLNQLKAAMQAEQQAEGRSGGPSVVLSMTHGSTTTGALSPSASTGGTILGTRHPAPTQMMRRESAPLDQPTTGDEASRLSLEVMLGPRPPAALWGGGLQRHTSPPRPLASRAPGVGSNDTFQAADELTRTNSGYEMLTQDAQAFDPSHHLNSARGFAADVGEGGAGAPGAAPGTNNVSADAVRASFESFGIAANLHGNRDHSIQLQRRVPVANNNGKNAGQHQQQDGAGSIRRGSSSIDGRFSLDPRKVASGVDPRTTVMIRNIPNKYNQSLLLSLLDNVAGGLYDFVYLPIDFRSGCNMGYAFVNMLESRGVLTLHAALDGKGWNIFNSDKVCSVTFARIQGSRALVEHFRSSMLLLQSGPECLPVLINAVTGERESFPTPRRQLSAQRAGPRGGGGQRRGSLDFQGAAEERVARRMASFDSQWDARVGMVQSARGPISWTSTWAEGISLPEEPFPPLAPVQNSSFFESEPHPLQRRGATAGRWPEPGAREEGGTAGGT